jgi:hypothetical protein
MINQIQVAEAKAWKQYRSAQKHGGYDEAFIDRLRSKWSGIFDLRESLGLPPLAPRELERLGLLVTIA